MQRVRGSMSIEWLVDSGIKHIQLQCARAHLCV